MAFTIRHLNNLSLLSSHISSIFIYSGRITKNLFIVFVIDIRWRIMDIHHLYVPRDPFHHVIQRSTWLQVPQEPMVHQDSRAIQEHPVPWDPLVKQVEQAQRDR